MQKRQRNVQKRVMHAQNLFIVVLLIKPMALFDELVAVASSDLKVPNN